ncbi:MAG: hypothetical protein HY923_09685 [Elusimicrobia bacterium]|nr:hypothetical protein [Elusimicrobiota bacterium]
MSERWLAVSTAYLTSKKAQDSLAADPYWPKWDSPWWHMTLLWEMGRADAIPKEAAEAMLKAIETKYVRFFPNPREPMPPGKDYHRDGLCHCGLGNMYQTLAACGLDLDHRAPWMRAWFLHYQLPDGGLNCDDKAYGGAGGSSSIQSTLPALEAVLGAGRPLTPGEEHFVDLGAEYLLERKLAFRRRDGQLMNPDFLNIGFPRFYDYDILRGLAFLSEWARLRRRRVPRRAVGWAFDSMEDRFPDARVRIEKEGLVATEDTLSQGKDGNWFRGKTSSFTLLDSVRKVGSPCEPLTRQWENIKKNLGPRLEG